MTTEPDRDLLIVGGGLGGCRLAEALRGHGFTGSITILSGEEHPPYDRPPLSKSVLLGTDDRVDLKSPEFFEEAGIELLLGARVTAVHPGQHSVEYVRHGAAHRLGYRTLVLATGLAPRPFPGEGGGLAGVHVLRTYDDAAALRTDLADARRAVVIGAGFIGCEAAASMAALGLEVTVVEPAAVPLAAAVGPVVGLLVARLHKEAGVDLRTATGAARLTGAAGRVTGVELTDGTLLPADVVLVGIGGTPDLEYLADSGIETAEPGSPGRDGILCGELGHTTVPDVYALGDAANWADAQGNRKRVEHWNHTVDQAAIVAAQIAGKALPPPAVPYFWSDQHALKIQVLGSPRPDDEVHVVDDDGRKFLAYYSRDGVLTGTAGAGRVGKLMKTRPLLLTDTPISDLLP